MRRLIQPLEVAQRLSTWKGLAVDFHVAGMTPHDVIEAVKHVIPYRTLIDEFGRWVHLDIERGKILKAHKKINGATHYDRIN